MTVFLGTDWEISNCSSRKCSSATDTWILITKAPDATFILIYRNVSENLLGEK